MSDKELLELAAKAAGIKVLAPPLNAAKLKGLYCWINKTRKPWNPLTDDGDALRLAVKLSIGIKSSGPDYWQEANTSIALYEIGEFGGRILVRHGDDPAHSTRRAIVSAAAQIGKTMP